MSTVTLEVQVSPWRLREVHEAANVALRRAGRPMRRWAVVVEAPGGEAPAARLEARESLWQRGTPIMREALALHPLEIPQIIIWGREGDDGASAEIYWIMPPEGSW